ncbi:hypothetical protein [Ruminococcus sp.]|uniref:hypothetical protein n=1 Tax=Ruminococcus sp. TaxID=41978 RepID=UPI0025CBB163|nr:hypothetical protein [Ruminococcus sp.]MBR1432694.1 hypothetical protein [Ruminococcus sp.]
MRNEKLYDGMTEAEAYSETIDGMYEPAVRDESDECVYRVSDRCKWESVKALLDKFVLGDPDNFLGEVVRPVCDHDAAVVIRLAHLDPDDFAEIVKLSENYVITPGDDYFEVSVKIKDFYLEAEF